MEPEYIDIVIPVYNEGENILSLLAAFEHEIRTPVRILVCYDMEEDTTLKALHSYRGDLEIIPVKNQGKFAHGAVLTGMRFSDAPAVITYMADDDYNAALVDRMAALFWDGCEVVCPSRFIPGGSMVGCRWQKAFFVRLASLTLHHLARLPAHDATNGFRLFSRRLLDRVRIESSQGFTYSIELLVKCHRLGWKTGELPAQWFERTAGSSRFRVFKWASSYLRWYWYAFATTYLRRKHVKSTSLDWEGVKAHILHRLESELSPLLTYHGVHHTRDDVLPAAERLAALAGLGSEETLLLRTAALFHDTGYILQNEQNEPIAAAIAGETLPRFGYSPEQIQTIQTMILATRLPQNPQNFLEELLCDADLDSLGREDFSQTSKSLQRERQSFSEALPDKDWYQIQLKFLQDHAYYTAVARQLRGTGKQKNIEQTIQLLGE